MSANAPLRILMAHNYYLEPGGEDLVFESEVDLLRERGHEVRTYVRRNEELQDAGELQSAASSIWARRSYREIDRMIREFRPHVVHFHNTFPLISASGYYAAKRHEVPVIQTLHNYRMTCPAATHFRDGEVCEDCLGKRIAWPAVLHACYRDHRALNAVVAGMLALHKSVGSYSRQVDAYIVVSQLMKDKMIEGGLSGSSIFIKPNFLPDPGPGEGSRDKVLFVGRLREEKGVQTLLDAWAELPEVPLEIVGSGPLERFVRDQIRERGLTNVVAVGFHPHKEVLEKVKRARLLVVPSLWHEGLPITVIEAFACGTPVVASDQGSLREMVEDGVQGYSFSVGDAAQLAASVRQLWNEEGKASTMGAAARAAYLERYTTEINYERLIEIYRGCIS